VVRKRREGVTTYPRYKGKAYSVAIGIFHGNEALALEYATKLTEARISGFGPFREGYRVIIPVLQRNDVPSGLWGLYRAYMCEIIHKVQQRKIATTDEIIEKWTRVANLDEAIMREIAGAIVEIVPPAPPPTPPEKGA